jgi:hypothetical protein
MSKIILVAFEVNGDDWEQAQRTLMQHLPRPFGAIECWWIAEDVRYDGSDNDSAVFVTPGVQIEAFTLLTTHGLTPTHNMPSNSLDGSSIWEPEVLRRHQRASTAYHAFDDPDSRWCSVCGLNIYDDGSHPKLRDNVYLPNGRRVNQHVEDGVWQAVPRASLTNIPDDLYVRGE